MGSVGSCPPRAGAAKGYDDIDFTVDHPIKQVSVRRPSKPRVLITKSDAVPFLPFASNTALAQPLAVTRHTTGRKRPFPHAPRRAEAVVHQERLQARGDAQGEPPIRGGAQGHLGAFTHKKKTAPAGGGDTIALFNLNLAPLSAVAARYRHATDPATSTRTPRRSWSASFGRR